MRQNNVIRYGIWICRGIYGLCIFFFLLFTTSVIYWHMNPEIFSIFEVSEAFKAGYGINDIRILTTENSPEYAVLLSELSAAILYWLYIRSVFFFAITWLMVKKIILVLGSIQSLQTFYQDNIEHFRDLAKLGFWGFLVSCFNIGFTDGDYQLNFSIVFGPLLFSMACLILSEVFREGKALLEDNNMIV